MKNFMYFENQEGGMSDYVVHDASEMSFLYGWKDGYCYDMDKALENWMEDAEVGDYAEHRLGVMVRVKDTE